MNTKPKTDNNLQLPALETGLGDTRLNSLGGQDEGTLRDGSIPLGDDGNLRIGLDWLALTYKFDSKDEFMDAMEFLFGWLHDEIDWTHDKPRKLGRWFTNCVKSVRGGTIGYNILEHGIDCYVSLSGQVLTSASPNDLRRGLIYLHPNYVSCSRVDIALDAHGCLLPNIRDSAFRSWSGGLQAGFEKYTTIESGNNPDNISITHYWGARDASLYVRIYDKDDYHRFEAECKRDKSGALYELLIKGFVDHDDILETYCNMLYAAIDKLDFYESRKDRNLGRNIRAEFWTNFLVAIQYKKIRLAPIDRTKTIEKALAWLERSVAPTIAMIKLALGQFFPQYWNDLVNSGTERMSKLQSLIAACCKETKEYAVV